MTRTQREQLLYQIADQQQGLFTTKQAIEAGYDRKAHLHHVKTENWIREWRGIYRLSRYPLSMEHEYVRWCLWSSDRQGTIQGVISHETALSIYELSDVNPSKIHMTVPKKFRKGSLIPNVLRLHVRDLENTEIKSRKGIQITTVIRTIKDIILDQTTSWEFIEQALIEAVSKGVLRRRYLSELKEWSHVLEETERSLLQQAIKEAKKR